MARKFRSNTTYRSLENPSCSGGTVVCAATTQEPDHDPILGSAAHGEASEAYARVEPQLASMRDADVLLVNLDVGRAVLTAFGALPALEALRPQIATALPSHPLDGLDKLRDYALAAWYANALALPAAAPSRRLQGLLDEAIPLRESLLVAADALAHAGLFDVARIAEIREGKGYLDTATDLVALSAMFHEQWAAIADKTAILREDVDRAEQLGTDLIMSLSTRAQPNGATSAAADRRARAFTLFVNAYDGCRRAVSYLRWNEDDVDAIAPSLFRKRRRASKPAGDGESDNSSAAMVGAVGGAAAHPLATSGDASRGSHP